MKKRREQLEGLDREALIEGYLLLEDRVRSLEKQAKDLRELLQARAPKTPENSSLPSGQSHKANQQAQPQGKRGAKVGHRGTSRSRSEPDEITEYRVRECPSCGEDWSQLAQHVAGRHQVIELPPLQPKVYEVVRYGRTCPRCGQYHRAEAPVGFEAGRVVGTQLERLVLYLRHAHPLSYQRVQRILADVCGVELSEGALVNIVHRSQAAVKQAATAIHEQVKRAPVIGSDETSVRLAGKNAWQWVFQTPTLAYYVIRPSRAAQVLQEVMTGAQPEVWVSDVLSSQMCHPAKTYQICLAHQVRDLQYAIDAHTCSWAAQLQSLFHHAVALGKQRSDLPADRYQQQVRQTDDALDTLLKSYPTNEDSQRLWRRYHKHRHALLVFLHRADVPPTNNASEQALRNSVIYRKVTGGFRTHWGADLYADMISILETARRQRRTILDVLSLVLARQPTFYG
jgi:transposase